MTFVFANLSLSVKILRKKSGWIGPMWENLGQIFSGFFQLSSADLFVASDVLIRKRGCFFLAPVFIYPYEFFVGLSAFAFSPCAMK